MLNSVQVFVEVVLILPTFVMLNGLFNLLIALIHFLTNYRYPIAFSFMCVGCVLTYPATLAVQAETFSEYIIKGVKVDFANDASAYWSKKFLSFSLICKLIQLIWFYLNLKFKGY